MGDAKALNLKVETLFLALEFAVVECIEWMESYNFASGDEEERGLLSAALQIRKDLENKIEWK
ncbi:hypothetical protein PU629_19420 [Pullulanibacillus sp. KACC 23026]|uniref:hypothetical protein n=1 Tax=Pullulanibacillus sp. KACC 23026 TaxID=3028315 RepID=UPI0023B0A887|nr:hypothetical protein [Pullulanibacillus sp. KACC 23026]WEG12259.1 hypothetical protein PU629_19420 [Pullulanibacillus sp. KACC 23026]